MPICIFTLIPASNGLARCPSRTGTNKDATNMPLRGFFSQAKTCPVFAALRGQSSLHADNMQVLIQTRWNLEISRHDIISKRPIPRVMTNSSLKSSTRGWQRPILMTRSSSCPMVGKVMPCRERLAALRAGHLRQCGGDKEIMQFHDPCSSEDKDVFTK